MGFSGQFGDMVSKFTINRPSVGITSLDGFCVILIPGDSQWRHFLIKNNILLFTGSEGLKRSMVVNNIALSMVSTVCQRTLLRSLKRLSEFKFLNDLVLMIVCSLLVECLLRTTTFIRWSGTDTISTPEITLLSSLLKKIRSMMVLDLLVMRVGSYQFVL